jgi:drug/metabolite transporter (DMT)-like permease
VAAAVTAVAAWGLGNTLIASVELPGLALAFYRLLLATLIYVPLLYLRGGRLTRRTFRYAWKGGVAFGADIATFFVAIRLTSVANATTISALQPLVIMGFAVVMFGERVRARHVASALVATAGVAMVAFGAAPGGSDSPVGDLMATAALFMWAWYFIASKQARTHLDTFEYMTAMNLIAFVVIAPVTILSGQLGTPTADLGDGRVLWILAIVLVPGSGHILINWAHGHTTLVTTSLITLAMPVISTVSAAVFLDQQVALVQAVGIAIVLGSLAVVILGDARSAGPVSGSTDPPP